MTRRHYTWVRISEGWATEEQLDGVPDWWVYKHESEWFAKGRTSAMICGPFPTRKAAVAHAEGDT